jgi:hypothetical protein
VKAAELSKVGKTVTKRGIGVVTRIGVPDGLEVLEPATHFVSNVTIGMVNLEPIAQAPTAESEGMDPLCQLRLARDGLEVADGALAADIQGAERNASCERLPCVFVESAADKAGLQDVIRSRRRIGRELLLRPSWVVRWDELLENVPEDFDGDGLHISTSGGLSCLVKVV